MPAKGKTILPIIRFEKKYTISENGCWIWTAGHKSDGYGCFWDGKKYVAAHQFSYFYYKGRVPEGLEIDHLCRVRDCVNPLHLEAVTHAENMRRGDVYKCMTERGKNTTHCLRGHEYTAENTYIQTQKCGKKTRSCKTCRKACTEHYLSKKLEKQL